jgi:hypothetical protein
MQSGSQTPLRLILRRPRSGRLEGWGGPMVRDALSQALLTMRPRLSRVGAARFAPLLTLSLSIAFCFHKPTMNGLPRIVFFAKRKEVRSIALQPTKEQEHSHNCTLVPVPHTPSALDFSFCIADLNSMLGLLREAITPAIQFVKCRSSNHSTRAWLSDKSATIYFSHFGASSTPLLVSMADCLDSISARTGSSTT